MIFFCLNSGILQIFRYLINLVLYIYSPACKNNINNNLNNFNYLFFRFLPKKIYTDVPLKDVNPDNKIKFEEASKLTNNKIIE
jgi:hypothetical protein